VAWSEECRRRDERRQRVNNADGEREDRVYNVAGWAVTI
jgi:hypothetical protein